MSGKLKTALAIALGWIIVSTSASGAMAEPRSAAGSGGESVAACQTSVGPPGEVVLQGNESALHCQLTRMRTGARANGWGGFATYAVLRDAAAALRLPNARPSLLITLPDTSNLPTAQFVVVTLAVRRGATREILLAQGFGESVTTIPMERRISTTNLQAPDQSNVPTGYIAWNVTPSTPLPPGEYAVIVYDRTNEDASPHGAGVKHRFYAFGVDQDAPPAN